MLGPLTEAFLEKIQLLVLIFLVLPAFPLLAQSTSSTPPSPPSPPARYGRRVGCWQQAGIPPSVAQQGREIERNTHSQVLSVCSDSSLNPQQKREQIRQLRQQSFEQLRGLVTEQQADAYKSCIEQRRGGRIGGERGAGPCGTWLRVRDREEIRLNRTSKLRRRSRALPLQGA